MKRRAPDSDEIVLRSSRKNEHKALGELAFSAFRVGEVERNVNYYRDHAHLRPQDTVVATQDGVMAGAASALRLTMSLCGKDVPVAGIAAVSVAPEFRRAGIADQLVRECLLRARKDKTALSMLYAFRESYYRKFGYGDVERWDKLSAATRYLPDSPLRRQVRKAESSKDKNDIKRIYEAARKGTTGQIVRSAWWWKARVFASADGQVIYENKKTGRAEGYLIYRVPKVPEFPNQGFRVIELRAMTAAAYRGLFGFLAALGEQYKSVALFLPPGDALAVLREPRVVEQTWAQTSVDIAAGYIGGGAMLRIVDVERALAIHPGPAARKIVGQVGLDLEDPVFADQTGQFDVTFGPGGARVASGRRCQQRLALTIDRLAQIYVATVGARRLLQLGFVAGSEKAAELLDAAFAGPALYVGPMSGF